MKEYLLPIGLVLLGVAIFLLWRALRRANPWSRTPYEQQEAFLSPAELAFYQVLDQLVGEDIAICPKPAVREILRVRPQVRRDRQKYFNWISQKHVDFVLCDRATMQVLCAVELDDSSHQRSDRRQRDAFMDKAFRKAKLPLFHIPCKRSYGARELGEEVPICPDCGIEMVLRTAQKGAYAGRQFYGCPNFPQCRQTMPYPLVQSGSRQKR